MLTENSGNVGVDEKLKISVDPQRTRAVLLWITIEAVVPLHVVSNNNVVRSKMLSICPETAKQARNLGASELVYGDSVNPKQPSIVSLVSEYANILKTPRARVFEVIMSREIFTLPLDQPRCVTMPVVELNTTGRP